METHELHRGRLIDHVQLVVRDLAASQTFYSAVFEVLGVPRNAPEIVVKQAYRNLIKTCHPDMLGGIVIEGSAAVAIDPELLAAANDRMAAINAAYSEIKKSRGWN